MWRITEKERVDSLTPELVPAQAPTEPPVHTIDVSMENKPTGIKIGAGVGGQVGGGGGIETGGGGTMGSAQSAGP